MKSTDKLKTKENQGLTSRQIIYQDLKKVEVEVRIAPYLNNLVKDYGSNLELGDSEWLVSRIAEFLQSQKWHSESHFIETCREITTHYTDYWKINVAVFKTAFIKVNYTN